MITVQVEVGNDAVGTSHILDQKSTRNKDDNIPGNRRNIINSGRDEQ